jgi:hypothetical protein
MSAWMAYVYMQKPKPDNATGVPVSIDVIDSNGNYRNIGEVTSDSNGFYSLNWKPDVPGKYTVFATFAGSESYWPSDAVTAFAVDEAVSPTQTPGTTEPQSITDMYFAPAVVAIIITIVIGFAATTILLLRKRP